MVRRGRPLPATRLGDGAALCVGAAAGAGACGGDAGALAADRRDGVCFAAAGAVLCFAAAGGVVFFAAAGAAAFFTAAGRVAFFAAGGVVFFAAAGAAAFFTAAGVVAFFAAAAGAAFFAAAGGAALFTAAGALVGVAFFAAGGVAFFAAFGGVAVFAAGGVAFSVFVIETFVVDAVAVPPDLAAVALERVVFGAGLAAPFAAAFATEAFFALAAVLAGLTGVFDLAVVVVAPAGFFAGGLGCLDAGAISSLLPKGGESWHESRTSATTLARAS